MQSLSIGGRYLSYRDFSLILFRNRKHRHRRSTFPIQLNRLDP